MNGKIGGTLFTLILCLLLVGNGCSKKGSESASDTPKAASERHASTLPTVGDLEQGTKDVQSLIRQGNSDMDAHRYLDAVNAYTRTLEIIPEDVDVRIDMGTCYRKMGKPEKAVQAYRKALSYQPDHPNGLANLGVVLAYDLKDPAGAVKVWEKFLSLYPNHPMAASIRQEVRRIRRIRIGKNTKNKS
ncbi:MAG: tetratricopeptide repeat protein [Deltaproteobacteria bacterium]|nr:tetratricopeptide repeat protein [Deltaproteobacteria bacterium]